MEQIATQLQFYTILTHENKFWYKSELTLKSKNKQKYELNQKNPRNKLKLNFVSLNESD